MEAFTLDLPTKLLVEITAGRTSSSDVVKNFKYNVFQGGLNLGEGSL